MASHFEKLSYNGKRIAKGTNHILAKAKDGELLLIPVQSNGKPIIRSAKQYSVQSSGKHVQTRLKQTYTALRVIAVYGPNAQQLHEQYRTMNYSLTPDGIEFPQPPLHPPVKPKPKRKRRYNGRNT